MGSGFRVTPGTALLAGTEATEGSLLEYPRSPPLLHHFPSAPFVSSTTNFSLHDECNMQIHSIALVGEGEPCRMGMYGSSGLQEERAQAAGHFIC